MAERPLYPSTLESLTKKALDVLQDPFYMQGGPQFQEIASLIGQLDFFRKNLVSSSNLKEFVELSKWHLNYEVHQYGTVLFKEQDYVDKIYIILQGKVCKLEQKPRNELEQEMKENELKSSLLMASEVQSVHLLKNGRGLRRKESLWSLNSRNQEINDNSLEILKTELLKSPSKLRGITSNIPSRKGSMKLDSETSIGDADSDGFRSSRNSIRIVKDKTSSSNFAPGTGILGANPPYQKKDPFKTRSSTFFHQSRLALQIPDSNFNLKGIEEENKGSTMVKLIESEQEVAGESSSLRLSQNSMKDNTTFIRYLVTKNPELEHRCFLKEVIRVFVSKVFASGEYFGENFCRHRKMKENSIIAVSSEEAHVLTITRESYFCIMEQILRRSNAKTKFFCQIFPSFKENAVVQFSNYWKEKCFQKGETIYQQQEKTQGLYYILAGEAILSKENQKRSFSSFSSQTKNLSGLIKSPKKSDFPIATIREGQFFGEEIVTGEQNRLYNITSNLPNTLVYVLEIKDYEKIKDRCSDFFEIIRKQAQERFEWRQGRASELLDPKKIDLTKLMGFSSSQTLNTLNSPNTRSPNFVEEDFQQDINSIFMRSSWSDLKHIPKKSILTQKLQVFREKFSRSLRASRVLTRQEIDTNNNSQTKEKGKEDSRLKSFESSVEKIDKSPDFINIRKELERPTSSVRSKSTKLTPSQSQAFSQGGFSQALNLKGLATTMSTFNTKPNEIKENHANKKAKKNPVTLSMAQKLAKFSYIKTSMLIEVGSPSFLRSKKSIIGASPVSAQRLDTLELSLESHRDKFEKYKSKLGTRLLRPNTVSLGQTFKGEKGRGQSAGKRKVSVMNSGLFSVK